MSMEYPCIYFEKNGRCRKFSDDTAVSYCVMGPCPEQTLSNADRIRSMSDEELAVVLCSADFCGCCDYERDNGICHYIETHPDGHLFDGCVKAALRYLQATSEEDT